MLSTVKSDNLVRILKTHVMKENHANKLFSVIHMLGTQIYTCIREFCNF